MTKAKAMAASQAMPGVTDKTTGRTPAWSAVHDSTDILARNSEQLV